LTDVLKGLQSFELVITVYQSKWHDSPEDLNSLHHYNYYELSYCFVTVHEDSCSNSTGIYETGLLHKRVLFLYFISVIYRAECAFWNCDQTNYVFNYSRLSELRVVLSSPPLWMEQFSQVWEYAVCYRWNCSFIFPVSRNSTNEYKKKIYTHHTYAVYNTNLLPPPFCAPPSKSFPHFVIVLLVLNQ